MLLEIAHAPRRGEISYNPPEPAKCQASLYASSPEAVCTLNINELQGGPKALGNAAESEAPDDSAVKQVARVFFALP